MGALVGAGHRPQLFDVLAHGWKRRAIASEAEVDRLRTALVRTGRAVGAFLSDSVSTDFLMHVPDEAEAKIKTLRNVVRLMTAVIADHGEPDDDCGLTNAQLDAWQQQARVALGDDAAAPRGRWSLWDRYDPFADVAPAKCLAENLTEDRAMALAYGLVRP